ncbi:MAG: CTP synthase [Bacteroidia bacterium]|nr:CTP synthase [Bacteroidia bacterium]MDW8346036.1 CTP synthase [Bacteroidia bacterium]
MATSAKYIFVTGGVTSSLGKGIISASLAKLLQARGYQVTIQKFDPYLNIDPGTMNPYEHGEVYVTDDGAETDLDLGHYERFLNIRTSRANNVTTGRIYNNVITRERNGEYKGKTVQIIPHITDEIKQCVTKLGESGEYHIVITEIGGTVGDIESLPYIEAIRQMRYEMGSTNVIVIHLTLIPYLATSGELKTKPTQHSVKTLLESGVQPDILVCRTEHSLTKEIKSKIALFCNLAPDAVMESIDAESIYDVPLLMRKENLDVVVLSKLNLPAAGEPNLKSWRNFLNKLKNPQDKITIALCGKYVELKDAYKSINEALVHAGAHQELKVTIKWIHSEDVNETNVERMLADVQGLLVAPGFGHRGIEGKIISIKYVRENKIPFFGICLGMQCAVIEFGRNVLGLHNANSLEFDPESPNPVISLMEQQKNVTQLGGTMRLGSYPCTLRKDTLAFEAYKKVNIRERHRHRYEFNNAYLKQYEEAGFIASGINEENNLVEIVEYKYHPFFIGAQFHPELKSTVEKPHPLFMAFVQAAYQYKQRTKQHKQNNVEI